MRHRGFGYVELVIGLAIVGALAAAAVGLYSTGKEAGHQEELAKWLERDNEELREAQDALEKERAKVKALQAKALEDLAKADQAHLRRLADANAKHAAFIADVRAGRVVLRDPGQNAAGPEACRGGTSSAAAPAGEGNGAGGGQLSREASEFLWSEAERADGLAEQLTLAQQVIEVYYSTCSAP